MFLLRVALLTVLTCVFAACSSSEVGRLRSSPVTSLRLVSARISEDVQAKAYMPEVLTALRSAGFTVVAKQKTPYEVELAFPGGGLDLNCAITLYEHDVPVLTAQSVNLGFGTWLARGTAYRRLFTAALRQFEKRLSRV